MLRKLTNDEKDKTKGGLSPDFIQPIDWCCYYCGVYCGDKEGSDAAMDSGNDQYRN